MITIKITITEPFHQMTLDAFFKTMGLAKSKQYQLFQGQHIMVDGMLATNTTKLLCGSLLTIEDDNVNVVKPVNKPITILYEDDYFLIVDKPAGMLVHDDGNNQVSVMALVANYLQKRHDEHVPYVVHRLDYETSGCLIVAKDHLMLSALTKMMSEKTINRHYLAWCEGNVELPKGSINYSIGRDRHHSGKMIVYDKGLKALTYYERVKTITFAQKNYSLLRLRLATGRTHQIRVHLQALNHPIVGDSLYGAKLNGPLMLHSATIDFVHPLTKEHIVIDCPEPIAFRHFGQ